MPETVAAKHTLSIVITRVSLDYPDISLVKNTRFSWHAGLRRITYRQTGLESVHDVWALLHELGHALLEHNEYTYDIELLQLEAAAWTKALEVAQNYSIVIDDDYIQDCLDTYRDWLHLRATCPTCFARSLQTAPHLYRCFNCQAEWTVSRSRFCRPYRLQKTA
jgi:hypothetical protein